MCVYEHAGVLCVCLSMNMQVFCVCVFVYEHAGVLCMCVRVYERT